uniref:Protein kinase domain-containing protein n=1 Tax=Arundo donax TaxID=35708 RepID=A0A0A8XQ16_ARUDO
MDLSLDGQYSAKAAHKAAMVAYHCLHSVPKSRPSMRDVVDALEPLLQMLSDVPAGPFVYTVPSPAADGGKAEEAADGAAAAKKKCLASAVHAEVELRTATVRELRCGVQELLSEAEQGQGRVELQQHQPLMHAC